MLRIDSGLMLAAVSRSSDVIGLRAEVGYPNRKSGEIRFPRWTGDRDRIEGAPDEWVEIPKYYGRDEDERDALIRDFLTTHGIDIASLD